MATGLVAGLGLWLLLRRLLLGLAAGVRGLRVLGGVSRVVGGRSGRSGLGRRGCGFRRGLDLRRDDLRYRGGCHTGCRGGRRGRERWRRGGQRIGDGLLGEDDPVDDLAGAGGEAMGNELGAVDHGGDEIADVERQQGRHDVLAGDDRRDRDVVEPADQAGAETDERRGDGLLQRQVHRDLALVALDDGDQNRPADHGRGTDQSRLDGAECADEVAGEYLLGDGDDESRDGGDGLLDTLARFGEADADGQDIVDLIDHPLPEGGELEDVGDRGRELDIGHLHGRYRRWVRGHCREGGQCGWRRRDGDDARSQESSGSGGESQAGCECVHRKLLTETVEREQI